MKPHTIKCAQQTKTNNHVLLPVEVPFGHFFKSSRVLGNKELLLLLIVVVVVIIIIKQWHSENRAQWACNK
jgi:hypothetical protein